MSKLREKQKEQRKYSILSATADLFTSKGYHDTTIEEIAELAEVGVATIYNYFYSKSELALALFLQGTRELMEEGLVILRNPPYDAVEAVSVLLSTYLQGMADRYDKRLLRELIAVTFNEQLSFRRRAIGLDFMLITQLSELIEHLQKRGQIDREVGVGEAAFLIYSIFCTDFIIFIVDDTMTLETLIQTIRYRVTLIFSGLTH
jgi:AcrR family transcriptional regulator